ncbi:uncharacterized protein LOC143293693 [Babylonia areolata]|uniref:uncharacterized protein LOC143293693 n=1 Tax=Babylonia areolata TaxID=304850 RepID=UPI003FD270D7
MPKYVLDLYEKYRSGELQGRPALGNTVRSIPAEIGEVNGEAMFIFNLSSVSATEQVMRAHVHLYKRKSTHRKRRSRSRVETELVLYEVSPHYLSQTGSIIMRSSAKGWQLYGATEAVLSCLLVNREQPHLFALSFRSEKPNGKMKPLALKKFARHHSMPFLILYSNETESINLEELDIVAERLKRNEDSEPEERRKKDQQEPENVDNESDDEAGTPVPVDGTGDDKVSGQDGFDEQQILDMFRGFGRKHHSGKQHKSNKKTGVHIKKHSTSTLKKDDYIAHVKITAQKSKKLDKTAMKVNKTPTREKSTLTDSEPQSSSNRKKRSILTNEIPEDPADYSKFHYRFNLPQTHPGMLTARKEYRHRLEQSRVIPYPMERTEAKKKSQRRRRKHRKRKNRRRNRKGRRRVLLPETWEDYHDNLATPDNNPGQVCSRHRLVVDFADIGWGDWIISPKSFEAHYCSGTCPFPLTKRLRPSNHATIQSIVNAIGLYSHVPAPCCVPDTMTSVTLLYFDENRNVVLKNYPGMSVQSCACR